MRTKDSFFLAETWKNYQLKFKLYRPGFHKYIYIMYYVYKIVNLYLYFNSFLYSDATMLLELAPSYVLSFQQTVWY